MKLKTHTFKLGKYHVDQDRDIEGYCDLPSLHDTLHMTIMSGEDLKALSSSVHEAMHAEGIPKKYLDEDRDAAQHIAKFLWRLGWRRKK